MFASQCSPLGFQCSPAVLAQYQLQMQIQTLRQCSQPIFTLSISLALGWEGASPLCRSPLKVTLASWVIP